MKISLKTNFKYVAFYIYLIFQEVLVYFLYCDAILLIKLFKYPNILSILLSETLKIIFLSE